jgi:Tol biopolymer transport system component
MGMKKTFLLLASVTVALLMASVVALVVPKERARAAFPGINGKIVFERDPDGYRGPKDPEIWTVWFDGNNLQHLTNNTTRDTAPAWSADGKKIVFSGGGRKAYDSYRADIFVMNANGSDKTRITDERKLPGPRKDDLTPSFSPSGRQIVFVRNGVNSHGDYTNRDIYRIRADGTNLTRLVDMPNYEYYYACCPAWSPDGSRIAFHSQLDISDFRTETIKPDGSGRSTLTYREGFAPDWSPDGSQVVFSGAGDIIKIDANGAGEKQLTTGQAYDSYPAFSPGGGKIVYSSDSDGDYDLYIKNADGTGDPQQITNQPGDDYFPDWQPVQ